MIYFLEHDSTGFIYHVCADPDASIVPLINRVLPLNADKTPVALSLPVGIDVATYSTLVTDGMDKYTFDSATNTIVKRVVA
ncbi:hypothetical protein [Granulicella sp. dw_53]|uniref:hypothetical protein n=1 Tax=Granulicella sp. dw_53 TaxID=2719792 RepID=UPI001BD34B73|nr:hypothetical protein [Granulicella sp. dw_53]